MKRIVRIGLTAAVTGSAVACHMVGGLGDLEFTDPGTAGSTTTSTSTTTAGGGAGGTGAAGAGATSTATGSQGGAGGSGGGSPVAACASPPLADSFDGSSLDASLWSSWTYSVTLGVGGGVAFAEAASAYGDYWGGFNTIDRFALNGCAVWLEVPQVFPAASPGGVYVELRADDSNEIQIFVWNDTIEFEIEEAGSSAAYQSIAYDPTGHRWWRFREQAGALFFETSPDAVQWTVQLTDATPGFLSNAELGFGAGTWDYDANPGRAEFDNVNLLP